jgi:hypothetical protein
MQGQGSGIERLERLDGARIAQLQRLIRAQVTRLGDTGSHAQGSSGK